MRAIGALAMFLVAVIGGGMFVGASVWFMFTWPWAFAILFVAVAVFALSRASARAS